MRSRRGRGGTMRGARKQARLNQRIGEDFPTAALVPAFLYSQRLLRVDGGSRVYALEPPVPNIKLTAT